MVYILISKTTYDIYLAYLLAIFCFSVFLLLPIKSYLSVRQKHPFKIKLLEWNQCKPKFIKDLSYCVVADPSPFWLS